MTREEAIKALEARRRSDDVVYVGDISYPEALSMAIEALKAQEPKLVACEAKRVLQDDSYDVATYADEVFYNCPKCGKRFSRYRPAKDIKYCSGCGQAVKWA